MATGTLNMLDLADKVPIALVGDAEGQHYRSVIQAAFAFMTVGASIKLALFPLHHWLPNAYAYAPSVVSAFLSATATKVSFYVLVRVVFTIFGVGLAAQTERLEDALLVLALSAVVGGSAVAIVQTDVKRLLAYSSIAQIGYFVLGFSLGNETAMTGGLIHLFNHALTKGGLFMALGCVAWRCGFARLDDMRGLGKRMPLTMLAFVVGGIGLIGVPLTSGFVSKWYLVLGCLEADLWWVAFLILVASLMAVAYVWKVVEVAYFSDPPEHDAHRQEAPLGMLIPTWAMIGATIVFGIWPSPMLGAARQAAEMLFGGVQ